MRLGRLTLAAVVLSVPLALTGLAAAGPLGGGTAIEVPGTATLNLGGAAQMTSIACPIPANCTGVGTYTDQAEAVHAFVVDETHGVWGDAAAVEIPNAPDNAYLQTLSCGSVGNCVAGGSEESFINGLGPWEQAFIVEETNGVWGGFQTVMSDQWAWVSPISCASAGNCSAISHGVHTGPGDDYETYILNEVNGVWGNRIDVPGLPADNLGGPVDSISCPSAGNCAAGGSYIDYNNGHTATEAWVGSEKNGSWSGLEVPGSAALNRRGWAEVTAVSCGSPENCSAGGFYSRSGKMLPFVVTEKAGVWGKATKLQGISSDWQTDPIVASISCRSAGNCSAGGTYTDSSVTHAFVVSQKKGVWGKAIEIPGLAAFGPNRPSGVSEISCATPGKCAVVGYFKNDAHHRQAFVADQRMWKWGPAVPVPGTEALNTGGKASSWSVSCAGKGHCAIAGDYHDNAGLQHAFVTSP